MARFANALLLAAIPLAGALAPGLAAAQFRSDVPEVLAPPPPAFDSREVQLDMSRQAYRRAGAPRIVVFWNRQLSDRTSNAQDLVVLKDGETTRGRGYSERHEGMAEVTTHSSETRIGQRDASDEARRSRFGEEEEWRFLEGFDGQLQKAGLRIVDRNLAMRAVAATEGASIDRQSAEMKGIAQYADLMMTVLETSDPQAPLGVLFKITVTDLRSGVVLLSLLSDGRGQPNGSGRFVAGAHGFERERDGEVTIPGAGANIAFETVMRMADRW